MPPLTEPEIERVRSLLMAIKDVAPRGHPKPMPINAASDKYRRAFEEYVAELEKARQRGEEWWNGLVEGIMERTGKKRGDAERAAKADSPHGPADHSAVIGAIRQNWLRVASLNAAARAAERVPPEQFMLGWLVDTKNLDLVRLIAPLPYWPVGLDLVKQDQWV